MAGRQIEFFPIPFRGFGIGRGKSIEIVGRPTRDPDTLPAFLSIAHVPDLTAHASSGKER